MTTALFSAQGVQLNGSLGTGLVRVQRVVDRQWWARELGRVDRPNRLAADDVVGRIAPLAVIQLEFTDIECEAGTSEMYRSRGSSLAPRAVRDSPVDVPAARAREEP